MSRVIKGLSDVPVLGIRGRHSQHPRSTTRGAKAVRVPINHAGANDAPGLVNAVTARTKVVFCVTPNPPSGGMLDAAELEHVIAGVPADKLLVVDEAYYEFARFDGGPDALALLSKRRGPWVVLRTFSKAYCLAGVRVGYALCSSDDVADAIRRMKTMYSPSAIGAAAAIAALEDEAHLQSVLSRVTKERERLHAGLVSLGLAPLPSHGNFVSTAIPVPVEAAMVRLAQAGIMVRDWRDPDYPREVRFSVGTADDTDAVLAELGKILDPATR